ncbi:MAG: hypothetical protein JKY41_04540, partial [Rhodobacteraceae bacterium]|nr:hypothetical protein [Paracoccaceae bacterium]
ESFFDYIPNAILILHGDIQQAGDAFASQVVERFIHRQHDIDRPPLPPELLFHDVNDLQKKMAGYPCVSLTSQIDGIDETAV